jgi:proteasome lid subunit RPN8/RPN11
MPSSDTQTPEPDAPAPLRVRAEAFNAIAAHAVRAYPNECCGALLARHLEGDDVLDIVRVEPLENQSTEPHVSRFLITADVVRTVERSAASAGLDLIGFYHSHPDAPPIASTYDNAHAVSWLVYIIMSCGSAGAGAARAYRYDMDARKLVEQTLEVSADVVA